MNKEIAFYHNSFVLESIYDYATHIAFKNNGSVYLHSTGASKVALTGPELIVMSSEEAIKKFNFVKIEKLEPSLDNTVFDTLGIDVTKEDYLFYEACKHPDKDVYTIVNALKDISDARPSENRRIFHGNEIRQHLSKPHYK